MTPVLVFDIETIPDVAGLRRLRAEWRDLADAEVAECAFEERRGGKGAAIFCRCTCSESLRFPACYATTLGSGSVRSVPQATPKQR